MDCSDWSNGIRYHILVTRPDTEFKSLKLLESSHLITWEMLELSRGCSC